MNSYNKLQYAANYFKKSGVIMVISLGIILIGIAAFSLFTNRIPNISNNNNRAVTLFISPTPAPTANTSTTGTTNTQFKSDGSTYIAYKIPTDFTESELASEERKYDTYHAKLYQKKTADNRDLWIEVKSTPNTAKQSFEEYIVAQYPKVKMIQKNNGRFKGQQGVIIVYTDPNDILLAITHILYVPNTYHTISTYSSITPESDKNAIMNELNNLRNDVMQNLDMSKLLNNATGEDINITTKNEKYLRDNGF